MASSAPWLIRGAAAAPLVQRAMTNPTVERAARAAATQARTIAQPMIQSAKESPRLQRLSRDAKLAAIRADQTLTTFKNPIRDLWRGLDANGRRRQLVTMAKGDKEALKGRWLTWIASELGGYGPIVTLIGSRMRRPSADDLVGWQPNPSGKRHVVKNPPERVKQIEDILRGRR